MLCLWKVIKEEFYFYLQYNGNEDELKKLNVLISNANPFYLDGDYSAFEIDINNLISENAVNEHLLSSLGYHCGKFTKCDGIFKLPAYTDNMSSDEIAIWIDQHFFACGIRNYFIN